jgi:phage gpG-like protein
MFTLLGMAAKLAQVAIDTDLACTIALTEAAEMVHEAAVALIGHPNSAWAALAESTLARKSADTPLLETGEMRASIEHVVRGRSAFVGSNNDKAVWQEFGTARIPPRSFIGMAAIECEERIHKLTREAVGHAFAGHGVGGLHELLHIYREVRELGRKLGELLPDDEEDRANKR